MGGGDGGGSGRRRESDGLRREGGVETRDRAGEGRGGIGWAVGGGRRSRRTGRDGIGQAIGSGGSLHYPLNS